jgi:PAS domain S-box-containing protein
MKRTEKAKTKGAGKKQIKQPWGTEFNYSVLLESLPQKIATKDRNSVYVFCNLNYARDLKIKPEKIAGRNDYEFFPRELADKYRADDKRIMDSGQAEQIEETYVHDGKKVTVNTFKAPVRDAKGKVVGVFVSFWEVTKYKELENETAKKNAVLNAINSVFKKALTCKTEEEFGKTCLAVAEELTGSKFGFFGELNPAGLFDTIAISNPGWDACKLESEEAKKVIRNMPVRGVDRSTMREEKSRIVNDVPSHPESKGIPEGHPPVKTFLGVPLKYLGKTVGMIGLANKEGGYDLSDQEAVEALSVAIVETLRGMRTESKLAQQAQEILEISTPVIQVWEGIVVAPLIGMLDSQRTQQFMERFMNSIVETNSPVAMVDITGVPAVDTQTAQHLIEAITAAKLLGTKVILTGVRPAIAQTLVHLGIDLSDVITRSSLSSGLKVALEMLNLEVRARSRMGKEA